MTSRPDPSRRYSEEEVRRLLSRAAELEGEEPAASRGAGPTLPELESIAAEAGIDPAGVTG